MKAVIFKLFGLLWLVRTRLSVATLISQIDLKRSVMSNLIFH